MTKGLVCDTIPANKTQVVMKFYSLIAIIFCAFTVNAQVVSSDTVLPETIFIYQEPVEHERFSVDTYVGGLFITNFPLDSITSTYESGSIRFGTKAGWDISEHFSIGGWGVYDRFEGEDLIIGDLTGTWNITSNLALKAGYTETPMTLLRPHPVSDFGHFEPWTYAQLPGGALGGRIEFGRTGKLIAGASLKNGGVDYQFGAIPDTEGGKLGMMFSFNSGDKNFAMAASLSELEFPRGITVTCIAYMEYITLYDSLLDQKSQSGLFISASFGDKKSISIYSDFGVEDRYVSKMSNPDDVDFKTEIVRGEWGAIKSFQNIGETKLSGLFGLGYRMEDNSIKGYLMVYI